MAKVPTAVRLICCTQTDVRVFSNALNSEGELEKWHFLWCPIIKLSDESTADWVDRQTEHVNEALDRIQHAKWVKDKDFKQVIEQLYNAGALVPYKWRVKFEHPKLGKAMIL
jgi:hypothetical protein